MSVRAVFNVASDSRLCSYSRGQKRLAEALTRFGGFGEHFISWCNQLPPGSPPHLDQRTPNRVGGYVQPAESLQANPYAFKAYALKHALTDRRRPTTLLWCDASILPIAPLEPLWERIERDGYWFSDNGWSNAQWTADSAYPLLFRQDDIERARVVNQAVKHVVATAFGISLDHTLGRTFIEEYVRLADAGAFKGPWWNSNAPDYATYKGAAPCGPPSTLGHRHDQTAASVIAWRLGMKLTPPPEIFAYAKWREDGSLHMEDQDPRTILMADGGY